MRVDKDFVTHTTMTEIESNTIIEIHPRLNFAFACGFLTDLTINSKEEVVKYLNSELFPFHKVKPLKILDTGKVSIKSNLNVFFSSNIINILGFSSFQKTKLTNQMRLPSFEIIEDLSKDIDIDGPSVMQFPDDLARLENESYIYTKYRQLIDDKPQGKIIIEYYTNYEISVLFV